MVGIARAGDETLDTGMERLHQGRVLTQLHEVVIEFLFQRRTDELVFERALQKQRTDCEQAAEQRAK